MAFLNAILIGRLSRDSSGSIDDARMTQSARIGGMILPEATSESAFSARTGCAFLMTRHVTSRTWPRLSLLPAKAKSRQINGRSG